MNEHASLYEYWRRLLMEEQQNEERNHWLMRKLDEIEQRTSLLSERSERLRQLRENFSELIRERYLSPEEMSYRYDYNQPTKASEYSPPEYIPDPILFGLSTPPWVPREGPLLLSRTQTPERWKPPRSPTAASVPPVHHQPRAPSPHPATKEQVSSPDRRPRYPDGETSEPWFNHFAKNSGGSLLEPSVYWMPDSAEFFRTTSALDRKPARSMAAEEEDNRQQVATDAASSTKQQHQQQQQYPSQQQMPSRMSQFSDYIPSNESPPAARRRLGPSTKPPDLEGVFINHTTEVLLSDTGATGKTYQQQEHRVGDTKKAADSDTSGDSFHQGDTDEGRHDPKLIPTVRLRKPSRNHGGQAAASRSREGQDNGPPLKKQGSFKQSRREASREATPSSRGAQPHPAPRNAAMSSRRPSNGGGAELSKSTPSASRTAAKDAHESERSSRRARQHARTAAHESLSDRSDVKPEARDASERSEATDTARGKDSDWSVSCGEQQQLSDSKQDASREGGQRSDEGARVQDSKLQLPTEQAHVSWHRQSGTDKLVRSGSEGQLLELDSSGHRTERRSVPAALVESRHLAGHSERMALPTGEGQETDHHETKHTNSGEAPKKSTDKSKGKSHQKSRSVSSSSSSSSKSSSSNSPKEAPGGKGKGHSNDNSEDSFFDKDILPQETTAYQFLLGNVKPTAPEKPSVMNQPSESSTDIENEMAAAVMTSQPKYKKSPEELEDSKAGSNDSSPPEYDVTSVNIQNLISAKVKHDVPSLISRKVLGLDMYSEPKIMQSQKHDDEDSFFD
ncbi:serine/arginine repetitive matrix protein 1 isoform X2 [Rhipicephalus sanguineus]|nr:serine/arginine repetitive matrix protein 1 isoform X2 [Rhipicephalus sanguineus]XP_037506993.1 serine/arginine repetitive matrix protein 1 isoform X2 [Rhipicephalus sanguineus]